MKLMTAINKYVLLIFISLFAFTNGFGQKQTVDEYIEKYKDVAVYEMYRSGIPASITLGQGILESGSGNSRLAVEGNNHFGIKCHKQWNGAFLKEDDDELQECFRKYNSALQSYLDHTEFLSTRDRYRFLFEYKPTDYKKWAYGLKKAGYATNPKYGHILVNIIEKYKLYEFDTAPPVELEIFADNGKTEPKDGDEQHVIKGLPTGIFITNRIKTIYLQQGQTLNEIAATYHVSLKKLKTYNEIKKGRELKPGMMVFLQPKRNKAAAKYHKVKEWETMYKISQQYGIKLYKLYSKNLLKPGEEPAIGQRIYLRARRKTKPKTRDISKDIKAQPKPKKQSKPAQKEIVLNTEQEKKELPGTKESNIPAGKREETNSGPVDEKKEPEQKQEGNLKYTYQSSPDTKQSNENKTIEEKMKDDLNIKPEESIEKETVLYHIVKVGDTLYSISKLYEVSVKDIQQWNQLDSPIIKIDQSLIINVTR
jgi:LysM repeat protein